MKLLKLFFPENLTQRKEALPPLKQTRKGVELKSPEAIKIMRQSGKIVATVLKEVSEFVKPGMTTAEVDFYAENRIREMGASPSFKGYHGFPASICISLNNEVVHGIPSKKKVIREGDILKVDTGAYFQGYHGDSCVTFPVGQVKPDAARLIRVAEEALYQAIAQVKPGNSILDLAIAVEEFVRSNGYSVVEDYTGHGVGRNLHEEPCVFNFKTDKIPNVKLKPGMTLAIEPIVNEGSKHTKVLGDRWTVVTVDKKLSAQFEHTVLVTETGYEILTDRQNLF
jgi:methionyl aminopeptidase